MRTFLVFGAVHRHAGGLGERLWRPQRLPFVAVALLLVACSANRMHRTVRDPVGDVGADALVSPRGTERMQTKELPWIISVEGWVAASRPN